MEAVILICIVVVILGIGAYVYFFQMEKAKTDTSDLNESEQDSEFRPETVKEKVGNALKILEAEKAEKAEEEAVAVDPVAVPESMTDTSPWCFVGEDLSGRYCVKIPSEKACTPDRLFPNRSECEMIEASHMPAGIVRDNKTLRRLQTMNIHEPPGLARSNKDQS